MSEKEMEFINDKYICIFCDERKHKSTAHITTDKIGICEECYEKLDKTSPSLPYSGTSDVSYVISPFEYTAKLRQAIIDFKFNNCWAYAPLFADMMKDYLNSYDIWDDFDYIIPVPLHKTRFKERGYNQSELIARYISEYIGIPMRTDILTRIRATKKQSTLKNVDRVLNVKGAFSCNTDLSGKNILLFDDIRTTGNTLQFCALPLRKANAKSVCAITLAVQVENKLPVITY